MKGGWVWKMPSEELPKNAKKYEERQQNNVAAFGNFGALRESLPAENGEGVVKVEI